MNYNRKDTIAALATTPGISAISVIRISGNNLKLLLVSITNQKNIKNRYAAYCTIVDKSENIIIDQCIVIYFAAPHSYTGEDVIEINCHGGEVVSKKILNMLYEHGVQPALAGEFSYRAFLNNKLNLIEAETISSLINANSNYSHDIIINNLNDSLKNNIAEINNKIINILTIIEHELDFSENEIDYTTNQSVLTILSEIQSTVQSYLNNQKLVQVINKGINIVIMGIPNAGKSSLFNQIVGYNRTIVSDEQGTTRDSIEMKLVINQYPINLIDTAGYFESKDQINIDSIKQTMKYSKTADIIIYLDEKDPINACSALNLQCNKIIFCKSKQDNAVNNLNNDGSINISSKNNLGIDVLNNTLSTYLSKEYSYDFNKDLMLISERQVKIFKQALELLNEITGLVENDVGMDIVASHMHELTSLFDECLGKISNEHVLNSIFSNFCVGK